MGTEELTGSLTGGVLADLGTEPRWMSGASQVLSGAGLQGLASGAWPWAPTGKAFGAFKDYT